MNACVIEHEAPETSRFLRIALYGILVGAACISLFFVGEYGPIPITELLDAWIVVLALTMLWRGRLRVPMVFTIVLIYLMVVFSLILLSGSPLLESLRAYRWLLYLLILAVVVGKRWGPVKPLIVSVWIIVSLALAKAVLTAMLVGLEERPGLYTENNFELALFAGMLIVLYERMGRYRFWLVPIMGLLTVLCQSRSGAVAFLLFAVYAVLASRVSDRFVRYIRFLALPLFACIPIIIFNERLEQSAFRIDRLDFLRVFQRETGEWGILNWMFGTLPLTQLSNDGCYALAYYVPAFHDSLDGSCYAAVMHAFVLRVIFDAGLLGLAVSILVPLWCLRRSGCTWAVTLAILLVVLSNGMSVSGLNSPYVFIPVLLAAMTGSSGQSRRREGPDKAVGRRTSRSRYSLGTSRVRRNSPLVG